MRKFFEESDRTYGSPRIHADLIEAGWQVSQKSVAASMAAQGLVARPKTRRRSLTRPDKAAAPLPDLVNRDFSADRINQKWWGDLTEIPTEEGKLYLATGRGLGVETHPGICPERAPRRRAGYRRAADGGRHQRRRCPRGHLPQRQGVRIHRLGLRGRLCPTGHHPVDGPGGIGPRQRGGREFQLDAGVGAVVPSTIRHQGRGPPGRRRLHRPLQPSPASSTCAMRSPIDFEADLAATATNVDEAA